MLMIVIPYSLRMTGVGSPRMIIFLNESSMFLNEFSSCLTFSSLTILYVTEYNSAGSLIADKIHFIAPADAFSSSVLTCLETTPISTLNPRISNSL